MPCTLPRRPGPPRARVVTAALVVAAIAAVASNGGCARSRTIADEGQIVDHPAGFALVVPDSWELRDVGDGLRLVGKTAVHDGYPTIEINPLEASSLPADFLDGRRFRWMGGSGSYRLRRWTNALGAGVRLTVHLQGERVSLAIESDLWDNGIRIDRAHFRQRVWPVINSIQELD